MLSDSPTVKVSRLVELEDFSIVVAGVLLSFFEDFPEDISIHHLLMVFHSIAEDFSLATSLVAYLVMKGVLEHLMSIVE